jgi:hypothetical protein
VPTCRENTPHLFVDGWRFGGFSNPRTQSFEYCAHQGELTMRVAESFAPGWWVEINGLVGAVKRSPYGLIEFTVPPSKDTSKVVVKYTPGGLWKGVWLTGLTFIGLALLSMPALVGRLTRLVARQC